MYKNESSLHSSFTCTVRKYFYCSGGTSQPRQSLASSALRMITPRIRAGGHLDKAPCVRDHSEGQVATALAWRGPSVVPRGWVLSPSPRSPLITEGLVTLCPLKA